MAADKEAIRPTAYRESTHTILSVTCPYSHCAFTTYLSTLFLSVLTLLVCTQSVDNLYHALTVLWENEYLVTYNLLCCFTSLKLHHRIIWFSLIRQSKRRYQRILCFDENCGSTNTVLRRMCGPEMNHLILSRYFLSVHVRCAWFVLKGTAT